MRILLLVFTAIIINSVGHGQILKKLGKELKEDAQWKVRMKANHKMDQALDSLLEQPKKVVEKKKKNSPSSDNSKQEKEKKVNSNVSSQDEMGMADGYVTVTLSAYEVFSGGTVTINGSSVKCSNLKEVKIAIDGPTGKSTESVPLKDDNSFSKSFQPTKPGNYTITAFSSDNKAKQVAELKVQDMSLPGNWTEENKNETQKSFDLLKKQTDKLKQQLADKDKAELDKKMGMAKKDVDDLLAFFDELNNAKENLTKTKAALPAPLMLKLSKLNDVLFDQKNQMKQIRETADHEPYDNTVCEYMVMVNEAATAFSTISNWSKAPLVILTEIIKENTPLGKKEEKEAGEQEYGPVVGQPAKIFALSKLKNEKLTAGHYTADLIEFTSNFLLKQYCNQVKGTVKHDYEIIYRNQLGTVWWKYKYQTESTINLRYPKNSGGGNIVKMKGSIEGNATKFDFYQDVEQQEDFKEAMKGRAKLNPVEIVHPITIPVSSSKYEGIGAVGRGLGTPSYFYIPVDAEFDRQANTMKLFLNEAVIDFSGMVKYKYAFWSIAAGIPLITVIDFPVNKAKLTLNAVVSKNNELNITSDAKNNLVIKGEGSRDIGNESSQIQHKIHFTLSGKSY